MKLTVLLPAFNEELIVGSVILSIRELYPDLSDTEILVVDDGSTDKTASVAQAAGARVIRHPYNKGNGAAIKTGIRAASGYVIVMMDADGQHNSREIDSLVQPIINSGYDMVVGARGDCQQQWHRSLANLIYNVFASYVTGFRVQDLTSGFRAIRSDLARQFCYMLPNTFSYPTTLTIAIIKGGYSIKYVPILASPRIGKSKIKILRDGMRFLIIITKIAILFSPIKIFLPIGGLIFLPGFVYSIYKLLTHEAWTIPITTSLSIGTLIVMIGFLAEQITLLRMQHIDNKPDS